MVPAWVHTVASTHCSGSLQRSRRPTSGALAETHVLEFDGDPGRAVCKRGGASVWTGDVIEPAVLELVDERTELPVPTVLGAGRVGDGRDTTRYGLYEYRRGTLPDRSPVLSGEELASQAGSWLGRLHAAFSFDRRGGLGQHDDVLRIERPRVPWLLETAMARHFLPTGPATAPAVPPVLAHGDFRPGNLLTDGDRITAILDWGNAHVTHPGLSIARAEVRFADTRAATAEERGRLRNHFRAGYAARRDIPPPIQENLGRFKRLWLCQAGANLARVATTATGRNQLWRQLHPRPDGAEWRWVS